MKTAIIFATIFFIGIGAGYAGGTNADVKSFFGCSLPK